MASSRPLLVGLTGPIGCGKSTVARWLGARGAIVIDADVLAREVTAPGTPGLAAVAARFGPAFLRADGSLDRAALGGLVFTDREALAGLEAIVHPAVRERVEARVAEAEAAGAPVVVVEAIKLVEGGLAGACDEVWLVTCLGATQRERLAGRGEDPAAVEQRIAAQGHLADRLRAVATRVIVTDGSADDTERAVADALADALAQHRAEAGAGA